MSPAKKPTPCPTFEIPSGDRGRPHQLGGPDWFAPIAPRSPENRKSGECLRCPQLGTRVGGSDGEAASEAASAQRLPKPTPCPGTEKARGNRRSLCQARPLGGSTVLGSSTIPGHQALNGKMIRADVSEGHAE